MRKILLPVFFVGTIVMMLVMARTGTPLKTPATPLGILDLEFAYNTAKTRAVINAWLPSRNMDVARSNTYLDFIFLFFYSGFLFLACKRIGQVIKGPVGRVGNMIAIAALVAGLLDVLENGGMLISLGGQVLPVVSFLTSFFSVIKWVLAIFAVLYVLTGLCVLGYRKWMS